LKTAKNLEKGSTIWHVNEKNSNGTAKKYKVTSIKTWKRTPGRVEVRAKRGLYENYRVTEERINQLTTKEPIYAKK
jgi:hypothetical protein